MGLLCTLVGSCRGLLEPLGDGGMCEAQAHLCTDPRQRSPAHTAAWRCPVRSAEEETETTSAVNNDLLLTDFMSYLWDSDVGRGTCYIPAAKATVVQIGADQASNQITEAGDSHFSGSVYACKASFIDSWNRRFWEFLLTTVIGMREIYMVFNLSEPSNKWHLNHFIYTEKSLKSTSSIQEIQLLYFLWKQLHMIILGK